MTFFKVLKYSVIIRIASVILLVILNIVNGDFDSSGSLALKDGCLFPGIITSFLRWDALFFLDIARNEYMLEQEYAFFPLYPLLLKRVKELVCMVYPFDDDVTLLVLIGVILGLIINVATCLVVYRVTRVFLKNDRLATISGIAYSLNPASVYQSSLYADGLFPLLTFLGIEAFYVKKSPFLAAIYWACGGFCRSNGIFLAGVFLWAALAKKEYPKYKLILGLLITAAPFVIFQRYAYERYCLIPTRQRPWCSSRLPLIYMFVQEHYWNVGFFRYFTVSQIPNLLIALPIYYMIADSLRQYLKRPSAILRKFGDDAFPLYVLLACFTLQILLFAHFQIIIRQVTSQLPFFFHLGQSLVDDTKIKWTLYVLIMYNVILHVTFANFYPPA